MQLTHENSNFPERKFPIVLVADGINSPANAGSLFRLADAFNIQKIVFCGKPIDLSSNRLKRTARSTAQTVTFEQREDTVTACEDLLSRGYCLFALEIAENSTSVSSFDFKKIDKVGLIIGNENVGISDEVLQLSHYRIHITMFGKNSSMNVAQATGIAFFEITKSLRSI